MDQIAYLENACIIDVIIFQWQREAKAKADREAKERKLAKKPEEERKVKILRGKILLKKHIKKNMKGEKAKTAAIKCTQDYRYGQ